MSHKNLLNPVTATALFTIALVIALAQFGNPTLQDVVQRFFALAIYGLLIFSYLLRIALVFLGVFALYRILRERVNGPDFKQMKPQAVVK